MPRASSPARSIALFISLSGSTFNLVLALKFYSLWSVLKSTEQESEWEGSLDSWSGESITLVWGLLSCYFAAEAVSSFIGFIGIFKNIPSFVRFCRDYSIADLFFVTFAAVSGAYAISTNSSIRAGVCEEVSSQPDFIRDLAEMGFNLENCELWFERAVIGVMTATAVVIMVRVHFVISISNYYSQLCRSQSSSSTSSSMYTALHSMGSTSLHRIYLLPAPTGSSSSRSANGKSEVYVYSPVALSSLSEEQAREMQAAEAWISRTEPSSRSSHRPTHRHHHSGRISLPVRPDEGLLPGYEKPV